MLELRSVCAGYGEGDVVRDLSLEARVNEVLCIIGPNGCGKTTLLKAVAGLLPYRGEMLLHGQPLRSMGAKALARRIALLSQTSELYFSYTVEETVMMGRYAHIQGGLWGRASREDREAVERCLLAVDLQKERHRDISRLSGGQLQRVFLARALAQDPEIILLDEPTNHLDFTYQAELVDYLRRWRQGAGKSVIGVFHDINLALSLADRVMLMKQGRAVAVGPVDQVITRPALEQVYQSDVAGYMLRSLRRWEKVC